MDDLAEGGGHGEGVVGVGLGDGGGAPGGDPVGLRLSSCLGEGGEGDEGEGGGEQGEAGGGGEAHGRRLLEGMDLRRIQHTTCAEGGRVRAAAGSLLRWASCEPRSQERDLGHAHPEMGGAREFGSGMHNSGGLVRIHRVCTDTIWHWRRR